MRGDIKLMWFYHFVIDRRRKIGLVLILVAIISVILMAISMFCLSREASANADGAEAVKLAMFRLCVIAILVIVIGVAMILACYGVKLEYIYLPAALLLGVAYMFAITPFSAPDETHHYYSSYILSGRLLLMDYPLQADVRHLDYTGFVGHYNVPDAYLRLVDEGVYRIRPDESEFASLPAAYMRQYMPWYIPQALGIAAARLLGLSFFGVFYLGRLFNLLFYLMCAFLAVKRTRSYRLPLMLTGLLPISLQQAASLSYDAFINGVSMLFIAGLVSYIYEENEFKWKGYIALLLPAVLLAPAKYIYTPIIMLVFLAARKSWGGRRVLKWALAGVIVALSVVFAVVVATGLSEPAQEDILNWEGGRNYSLAFVFEHPVRTLVIFARSFLDSFLYNICGAFGMLLSGMTLRLPFAFTLVSMVLLLASVSNSDKDEWLPALGERVAYLLTILVVVGLCMAVMFLFWTSDTHEIIQGVQGRYFTMLIPLALLAFKNRLISIPPSVFRYALTLAFLLVQCASVVFILDYTIGR